MKKFILALNVLCALGAALAEPASAAHTHAKRTAETPKQESYEPSTDPRCLFYYHAPSSFTDESALTRAGVRLDNIQIVQEQEKFGAWAAYKHNQGPFVRKSQPPPKFIYGYIEPATSNGDTTVVDGVHLNTVYALRGSNYALIFPKKKAIPCGSVLIYPKKWHVLPRAFEILDATFIPSKADQ